MFTKRRTDVTQPGTESQKANAPEATQSSPQQPEPRPASNTTLMKPSIISEGFELIGDLVSNGVVHVEGSVKGKLSLSTVTIGSKGSVEGTIECETLHIKGHFKGVAHCHDLSLSTDAEVDGQIHYSQMAVQRGGRLTGELIKE